MSQVTQKEIITDHLSTNSLTIGDVTVDGILDATHPANTENPNALINNGHLNVALKYLRDLSKVIDPTGSGIPEQTLISNSLLTPYFQNIEEYELQQWILDNNFVLHAIGGKSDNQLQIRQSNLKRLGTYLLYLDISKMPIASKLEIYAGTTWIATISTNGEHYYEIPYTEFQPINLIAKDVASGTTLDIQGVELYYIAERFYIYLIQKVKSLATITSDDFVTIAAFNKAMEQFTDQFQQATEQYLKKLDEHATAENPHEITAAMIHAAAEDHGHEGMVTEANIEQLISEFADEQYAAKEHEHENYVNQDQLRGTVAEVIVEELSTLVAIDAMTIVSAETGVLPSRLLASDIDTPAQILLPTVVNHTADSTYDMNHGLITTNEKFLIGEAPKVFSLTPEFCEIPSSLVNTPLNFRIKYHHDRKVRGYRISTREALPVKWTVYSDDYTFVHEVTDASFEEVSAGTQQAEILFDTEKTLNSLSFLLTEVTTVDDYWELKIEILYSDFAINEFGITNKAFAFTVSDKGTNRIVYNDSTQIAPLKCTPKVLVPNTPLYIFGGREPNESVPSFYSSYYKPEYNNTRLGYLAFEDKYTGLDKHIVSGAEQYQHPAYGNLSLKEGVTYPSMLLTSIYSSDDNGWMSDGNSSIVTIEQTITSPNVLLCGYSLKWLEADLEKIPSKWTLTIEGQTETGVKNVIVLDSVKEYYPFYSAEEGDIVYAKRFEPTIKVSRIILTMEKEAAHVISLNKLQLYLSERYHSTSKNISYLGLTPVSQMCLGSAIYQNDILGWETNNLFIGKSVTIPVNNMEPTEDNKTYTFVNPYFTTDVFPTVKIKALDEDGSSAVAAVGKITDDQGSLHSVSGARYAVNLSRVW